MLTIFSNKTLLFIVAHKRLWFAYLVITHLLLLVYIYFFRVTANNNNWYLLSLIFTLYHVFPYWFYRWTVRKYTEGYNKLP